MPINDRIERVARVIAEHVGFLDDLDSDPQSVQEVHLHPVALARALDRAGLIAPGPLREEWAATWEGHGATRIGVAQESPEDIEGVPPGGWVVHRYVTAWEPTDGIDRSEGGGKAATNE